MPMPFTEIENPAGDTSGWRQASRILSRICEVRNAHETFTWSRGLTAMGLWVRAGPRGDSDALNIEML